MSKIKVNEMGTARQEFRLSKLQKVNSLYQAMRSKQIKRKNIKFEDSAG